MQKEISAEFATVADNQMAHLVDLIGVYGRQKPDEEPDLQTGDRMTYGQSE
jgi:hypothetical protein